jgi:hypothetical protein
MGAVLQVPPACWRGIEAARAGCQHGGVISDGLEELEERTFWLAVDRAHARLAEADRQAYRDIPANQDGLLDEVDMKISRNDEW